MSKERIVKYMFDVLVDKLAITPVVKCTEPRKTTFWGCLIAIKPIQIKIGLRERKYSSTLYFFNPEDPNNILFSFQDYKVKDEGKRREIEKIDWNLPEFCIDPKKREYRRIVSKKLNKLFKKLKTQTSVTF